MSGTGKRADHLKTLVLKLYGNNYFGKQGVTSRRTQRDTRQRINIKDIELHIEKYGKRSNAGYVVNLQDYKILGEGEVKNKIFVKCFEVSESARKKIEKAGGSIEVAQKKEIITPVISNPKHERKAAKKE